MNETPATETPLPALGDIIGRAMSVVIDRPRLFLTIWAATGLPALVITTAAAAAFGLQDKEAIKAALESGQYGGLAGFFLVAIAGKAVETVGFVATIVAAAECAAGREPETGRSLEAGLGRFPAVLWTSAVAGLRILFGFLLFIIPGVVLAIRYGFAHLAATLEGLSGSAAANRSKDLIVPHMSKVIGNTMVFGLIALCAGGAIAAAGFLAQGAAEMLMGRIAGFVVGAALHGAGSLVSAWAAAASVILYLALTARVPRAA